MYYRRKILLTLLEECNNKLPKIKLQKLLLLLSDLQDKPSFEFVPYKYGCFSFQSNADLNTMIKYEQVRETQEEWIRIDGASYKNQLKNNDYEKIKFIKNSFGDKTSWELMELTYKKFPFYATNSTVIEKVLKDEKDIERVSSSINISRKKALYTIGYEGITLEAYLNKLLTNGIKALIDVRKNPLSMKYGFSKNQLKNSCNGIGIQYYHLPELGIASNKRQKLETQRDYDELFEDYKKNNLPNTTSTQEEIIDLLKDYDRVALTCFEANSCQCHRRPLAESVANLPTFKWTVNHIENA